MDPKRRSPIGSRHGAMLFEMPMSSVAYITCSLPLVGIILCVIVSLWEIEYSTNPRCTVIEQIFGAPLQSFSSVIRKSYQCYIWQICVALHMTQRFDTPYIYYTIHKRWFSTYSTWSIRGILIRVIYLANMVELFSLAFLTVLTKEQHSHLHFRGFMYFVISNMIYSCLTIWLHSRARSLNSLDPPMNPRSFRIKKMCLAIQVICFFALQYWFKYTYKDCEGKPWNFFIIAEITYITANIVFAGTIYMDTGSTTTYYVHQSHIDID